MRSVDHFDAAEVELLACDRNGVAGLRVLVVDDPEVVGDPAQREEPGPQHHIDLDLDLDLVVDVVEPADAGIPDEQFSW